MNIKLSDHFTYKKLLRFTIPSICMMLFTSIYGIVDGIFVSNYAGKEAFTAVNFIMPYIMLLSAGGFMLGTGGTALVSFVIGQGKKKTALEYFSFIIYSSIVIGIILTILGLLLLEPIARFLGAEGTLLDNCILYGRITILGTPFFMLQYAFQEFYIAAEKPNLGLLTTVLAGVSNIVLDFVLVGLLHYDLVGAAIATIISMAVGGLIPIIYFAFPNKSILRLGKTKFHGKALLKACANGSSELLSNISMSVVGMIYNAQLIKYVGEDGVSAYGVLMYVCLIFLSAFIGYSTGIAPVISYNHGADNRNELKNILKKSVLVILISSISMCVLSELLGGFVSNIYVGYDEGLKSLTTRAFTIYSFSFLFSGIGIFGSALFTALNNGPVSAIMSVSRTLIFQIISVLVLPLIFGTDGIWLSIVVGDFLAAILNIIIIFAFRKKYRYI